MQTSLGTHGTLLSHVSRIHVSRTLSPVTNSVIHANKSEDITWHAQDAHNSCVTNSCVTNSVICHELCHIYEQGGRHHVAHTRRLTHVSRTLSYVTKSIILTHASRTLSMKISLGTQETLLTHVSRTHASQTISCVTNSIILTLVSQTLSIKTSLGTQETKLMCHGLYHLSRTLLYM